jgi:hypothetical protein
MYYILIYLYYFNYNRNDRSGSAWFLIGNLEILENWEQCRKDGGKSVMANGEHRILLEVCRESC